MTELVSNRRARHDYQILETLEAGISLVGTEVKSLRNHGGSLQDAFVTIDTTGRVWLQNASIAPYSPAHIALQHEERRRRPLLLHQQEIRRLQKITQEKGCTLIPLSIYTKGPYIKVQVAAVKGKKQYDKRQAIREREEKRSLSRMKKI